MVYSNERWNMHMNEKKEHGGTNKQPYTETANIIIEDIRKAVDRADREGWVSDDEIQKIMKE